MDRPPPALSIEIQRRRGKKMRLKMLKSNLPLTQCGKLRCRKKREETTMPELSSQQESTPSQGESLSHLDYLREMEDNARTHLDYVRETKEAWEQILRELEDGTFKLGSQEELEQQKARARGEIERSRQEELKEEEKLKKLDAGKNGK